MRSVMLRDFVQGGVVEQNRHQRESLTPRLPLSNGNCLA